MTVEEIRGGNGGFDDFSVGMRVLAVDDDPICLKLLDGLLRKCQYQVTTTSQARMALKMLRENKDRFDLVISDVHMPDMDGFKLLELVGLEMDLPVIMLSANSDPRLVMKGVTHGACDYLVKPVRIEELRNIWQHVFRRKKFDPKHQNASSHQENGQQGNSEGGQVPSVAGDADLNGKLNKRRKDDEDEDEENDNENEDPAAQKKPRVVWSIELHRKFVAAVNQLGIDKAVPKRILDLMNVEGITRENVASHLQKYRLYLKRISSVATHQANMVAGLGSRDAYMQMGSLDGLGDYQTLAGSRRLTNTVLSPYTPSGMLGRLNSQIGVGLHNLSSSGLIQPGHPQNFSNSVNPFVQLPPVISPASHNPNLVQGTTPPLELDQLQQNRCTTRLATNDSRMFTTSSTFTDTRSTIRNSCNSLSSVPNSSVVLRDNCSPLNGVGLMNQSSLSRTSLSANSFSAGVIGYSNYLDAGRGNDNWQRANQLPEFQSNSSHLTDSLNQSHFPVSNVRNNHSSAVPSLLNPLDFSATNTVSAQDSRIGLNCQPSFIGEAVSNFNELHPMWGDHKQNHSHNDVNSLSPQNFQLPENTANQTLDQNSMMVNRQMEIPLVGQLNGSASTLLRPGEADQLNADRRTRSNEDYHFGQTKAQGAFVPPSYDSLDDLMNSMIKPEQDGETSDGEFGFDPYSFGSTV